jgi:hypothetical protein
MKFDEAYDKFFKKDVTDPKSIIEVVEVLISTVFLLEKARLDESKIKNDVSLIGKIDRCTTTIWYYIEMFRRMLDDATVIDIKKLNSYLPILAGHVESAYDDYSTFVISEDALFTLERLKLRLASIIDTYNLNRKQKVITWQRAIDTWNSYPEDKKRKINTDWESRIRKYGSDRSGLKPINFKVLD